MAENTVRKITDAEWKVQIRHLKGDAVSLRDRWTDLKEATSVAKKAYDEAVEMLIQAVGEDDLPLFVQDEDDE